MRELNRREPQAAASRPPETRLRRRCHVLVEFPHPELEAVVVQWEGYLPTVLIQMKRDTREPLQFYGKRSDIPGYAEMPKADPPELDQTLKNFINPANGTPFSDFPWLADIVFSARAFSYMQPEPDLVLPADSLWECRQEALSALQLKDESLSAPA
jgi:hypothetical protein